MRGAEGDRDFLQWDTVSLMSLLGVHVILGYYTDAEINPRNAAKITKQQFDVPYIRNKIVDILSYQSDALHWNLSQIDRVGEVAQKALENYDRISEDLDVPMHSWDTAQRRIEQLQESKATFLCLSRTLAQAAQERETEMTQPKEFVDGTKATVTINNYLGGLYYLTVDECEVDESSISLIEAKHSTRGFPSISDIKDGLIKMILFSNLVNVRVDGKELNSNAVLKLTTPDGFDVNMLTATRKAQLDLLRKEANTNGFSIRIE